VRFKVDRLRGMAVFAAVVDARSMSGAARELGLTPSAVSQHVRQLERALRVVLLRRSTRRLALTEAGEAFYEGCAAMLAGARGAEQRLAELRDAPVGELSLSSPAGFAAHHLTSALAPLLAAHRQLSLRLLISDEILDPIEARVDVALRIGRQVDPKHAAIPLAEWDFLMCAAPAYLSRRGAPASPEDLPDHEWLTLIRVGKHALLDLAGSGGQRRRVRVEGRIRSNNQLSLKLLALAGCGISLQVLPEIENELADGRLLRVLPDWSLPPLGVFAVTSRRDAQPAKIRYALEALRGYLGDPARWPRPGRRLPASPR
jgi:DNA-binding transcriptional LysR family regulator